MLLIGYFFSKKKYSMLTPSVGVKWAEWFKEEKENIFFKRSQGAEPLVIDFMIMINNSIVTDK